MMNDSFEKLRVYFESKPSYWRLSDIQTEFRVFPVYPLSFRDRLDKNHYTEFDEKGLPRFHSRKGNLVYFCTGLCSFALAHWEYYQATGRSNHTDLFLAVADKLLTLTVVQDEVYMIYDYDDDNGTNPLPCAMNNGEAISVLVRAFALTGDLVYLDAAEKLGRAFLNDYSIKGVSGFISPKHIWFLEGGKIILNGHVYALFGLIDLSSFIKASWLLELIRQGKESIRVSLNLFDSGFWSNYWVNEPKYMASAMYHNLHVCQLRALYNSTGIYEFSDYADRFASYAENPVFRLWAGFMLVFGKLQMKLLKA